MGCSGSRRMDFFVHKCEKVREIIAFPSLVNGKNITFHFVPCSALNCSYSVCYNFLSVLFSFGPYCPITFSPG